MGAFVAMGSVSPGEEMIRFVIIGTVMPLVGSCAVGVTAVIETTVGANVGAEEVLVVVVSTVGGEEGLGKGAVPVSTICAAPMEVGVAVVPIVGVAVPVWAVSCPFPP